MSRDEHLGNATLFGRRVAGVVLLSLVAACGGDSGGVGKDRPGLVISDGEGSYEFSEVVCEEALITATSPVSDVDSTGSPFATAEIRFDGVGGEVVLFEEDAEAPVSVGEFDEIEVDSDTGARSAVLSFESGDGELSFNCP